jgi:hypothetical protein
LQPPEQLRPAAAPPPIPTIVPSVSPGEPGQIEGDTTGGLIPYKNPNALTAYYLGLFSLIPFLGIVSGIAAVCLGIKGLRYGKQNPVVKGKVHAWIGIICGGFWALIYTALIVLLIPLLLSARR